MHQRLVDYHCHLDLYPDHKAAFAHCRDSSIETLAVTTTPRAWEKNKELASDCPSVRIALGLHPQLIADGHDESQLFEQLLPKTKYVGEVGLDAGPRYYHSFSTQKRIFERILCCCAEHGNKILSIHAVRAVRETLSLVQKNLPPDSGKVVFHWFTGSKAEAKLAADFGCYFSINRQMMTSDARREIVRSLPVRQILTETDGPFTIVNNRPAIPSDVGETVNILAGVLGCSPLDLSSQIWENLEGLEGA
jgi:TatD DNase family protein